MSAAESEPRRLTPTERLHEVTMAAMLRPRTEPESSVTLTRNAKGDVQVEIVVRAADSASAYDQAVELYDAAVKRYPRENGSQEAAGAAVTASEPKAKGASRVGA